MAGLRASHHSISPPLLPPFHLSTDRLRTPSPDGTWTAQLDFQSQLLRSRAHALPGRQPGTRLAFGLRAAHPSPARQAGGGRDPSEGFSVARTLARVLVGVWRSMPGDEGNHPAATWAACTRPTSFRGNGCHKHISLCPRSSRGVRSFRAVAAEAPLIRLNTWLGANHLPDKGARSPAIHVCPSTKSKSDSSPLQGCQ